MYRSKLPYIINSLRCKHFSTTSANLLKEVKITKKEDATIIEGVYVQSDKQGKVLEIEDKKQFCPLCPHKLGCVVKYTDVLVISQFVKPDGEVLKPHVTGLCQKAQKHLRHITLRAQRAGLIPQWVEDQPGGPRYDMRDYKWRKYNCYFEDGFETNLSDE